MLGKIERLGAARRDQDLEALVTRQIDQHARIMRVVLDNEENGISGFEVQPVVRQLFDDALTRGATVGPEYFNGR